MVGNNKTKGLILEINKKMDHNNDMIIPERLTNISCFI